MTRQELMRAVRTVRTMCGDSQEEFARRLHTTATSVSRIERGLQRPGGNILHTLERVAREYTLEDEARLFSAARGPNDSGRLLIPADSRELSGITEALNRIATALESRAVDTEVQP